MEKELLHILIEERKARAETLSKEECKEQGHQRTPADGETSFSVHFPDYVDLYHRMGHRFDQLCACIQAEYDAIAGRMEPTADDVEKAFAEAAHRSEWKGVLFRMRKYRTTAEQALLHHSLKTVHVWFTSWQPS